MTRKGADVRIVAGFFQGGKGQFFLLAIVHEFGCPKYVGTFGDEGHGKPLGPEGQRLLGYGVGLVRLGEDEVVRHEVGVGENQLDLLTRFDREFVQVVLHFFHHRTDANRGQLRRIGKDARFLDDFRDFLLDHLRSFGRIRIVPMMLNREGGHPCVWFGRLEQVVEQAAVSAVVLLMYPKRFQKMVRVLFLFGVELLDPLLGCGDDFVGIASAQFDPGAMTDTVDRVFEVLEQFLNGLSLDRDFFLERLLRVAYAEDASVLMVAVRVPDVVLHVPDDYVLPVGYVEGSVFTENGVGRPEVLVSAQEKAVGLLVLLASVGQSLGDFQSFPVRSAPHFSYFGFLNDFLGILAASHRFRLLETAAMQLVLFDTEEADRVAD